MIHVNCKKNDVNLTSSAKINCNFLGIHPDFMGFFHGIHPSKEGENPGSWTGNFDPNTTVIDNMEGLQCASLHSLELCNLSIQWPFVFFFFYGENGFSSDLSLWYIIKGYSRIHHLYMYSIIILVCKYWFIYDVFIPDDWINFDFW